MTKNSDNRLVKVFIDLESNMARNKFLRPQMEEELKSEINAEIPDMVSRLAELEPIFTADVGDFTSIIREATKAYMYKHWRSVVVLIGVTSEAFIDDLYSRHDKLGSASGYYATKKELFGEDDRVSYKRKLAILRFFGLLTKSNCTKLSRIKKLRDAHAHPRKEERDEHKDAKEAMRLFRACLKERFNAEYAIEEGRVVRRQKPNGNKQRKGHM